MKNINPVSTRYVIDKLEQRSLYTCPADKAYAIVKTHVTVIGDQDRDIEFSLYIREAVEGLVTANEAYLTSLKLKGGVIAPEILELSIPSGNELVFRADKSDAQLTVRTDGLEFMDDTYLESRTDKLLSMKANEWINVSKNARSTDQESRVELSFTNNVSDRSEIQIAVSNSDSVTTTNEIGRLQLLKGDGIIAENILLGLRDSVFVRTDSSSTNVIVNSLNTNRDLSDIRISNRQVTVTTPEETSTLVTTTGGISHTRVTLNLSIVTTDIGSESSEVSLYLAPLGSQSQLTDERLLLNRYFVISPYVSPEVAGIIVPNGYSLILRKGQGGPVNVNICSEVFPTEKTRTVTSTKNITIAKDPYIFSEVQPKALFSTGSIVISNVDGAEIEVGLYVESDGTLTNEENLLMKFLIEPHSSVMVSNIRIGNGSKVRLTSTGANTVATYNGTDHIVE